MLAVTSRIRLALCFALACVIAPAASRANGRFPASNYFVAGPGSESRVLALRTTFGLANSQDGGRTWGWVCEEALNAVGTFDASIAIGFDGSVVLGAPLGLSVSRGSCAWGSPVGNPMRSVVDIANDATGRYMVAVTGPSGVDDTLLLSADGGARWTRGARIPDFFSETVEVAPSTPSRIYVSGLTRAGVPVLLRSDDGGMTTSEVARDRAFLSGVNAFISGVDPTSPDVVYVRSPAGFGTALLRSDNGGRSFRELTRTADQMLGFALSDDGSTLWVASASRAEGILRSVRGGPFRRVASTVTARCLRQHAGVLYVCADEGLDGYMLGSSVDGGDHFEALMSARLLAGVASTCGAGTQVGMTCDPLWPTQRMTLASIDGGAPPMLVARDAGLVDIDTETRGAPDASGFDVSEADIVDAASIDTAADVAAVDSALDARDAIAASEDASQPPRGGCSCRAGALSSSAKGSCVAALAVMALRRRRRPSRRGAS